MKLQDDPHLVEEQTVRYSRPWARRSRFSQSDNNTYQSNVIHIFCINLDNHETLLQNLIYINSKEHIFQNENFTVSK